MADSTVDSILIEIEAPAEKAKGGLEQIKKSLMSMKDATKNIDIEKLRQTATAIEQISKAGEGAKNAGQGIRSITSSVKSLEGISSNRLKKVADAIQKISTSLGNMGNNNKTSIRIDSEGVTKAIKPLEDMANSSAMQNMQQAASQAAGAIDNLARTQANAAQSAQANSSAIQQEGNAAQAAASGVNTLLDVEDRSAQSANNAASAQSNLNSSLSNQTGANTATAEIQELINKINQYKATISQMESGKQLFNAEEYEQAVQGLSKAQEEFNRFKETVQNSPKSLNDVAKSFQNIGQEAQKCGLGGFGNALMNIANILPMIQLGGVEASAGFQSMAVGLEALQTAIPIIGIILTLITAIINGARSIANSVKTTVQNVVAKVKSGVSKIRTALVGLKNWIGNLFSDIKKKLVIQDKAIGDLSKKLRTFMRLFTFMALRKALTALFSNIGNSFNLLAQYSDMMGTRFNKSVSLIVSDAKWLSNSMIAAFEPILNAIAPILDALISKLVAAINAINQFFAALTGAKFWTKAKKNVENYAGGLDKTAGSAKKAKKEIKDLTTGIDELNILRQPDDDADSGSGGGAGGVNPADYFDTEEVDKKWKDFIDWIKEMWEDADFTELGKLLGDKLAAALASIPWDEIKKNARKIGKALATFINGFIQDEFDGKSVSWWIGHTIAESINTAFEFLNSFVTHLDWSALGKAFTDLIKGALESLDWPLIYDTLRKLRKGIADFLNSVFRDTKTWEEVGTAISNALNAIIWGAMAFVDEFDFGDFGKAIATGLGNALTGIDWIGIGLTLTTGINGVFTALKTFAGTFPWWEVAFKFATGINSALANLDWNTIKSGFTKFCEGIGTNLNTAITNINWGLVGRTLGNSINTLFSGIGAFLKKIDFKKIGNDIADFINNAVNSIDWKNAGETINLIVNGIADLVDAVIDKVDWFKLMSGVADAIKEVDWDRLTATIFKVFAAKWTFKNMFKGVVWGSIATSIAGGIADGFANVGNKIWNGLKKALGLENGTSKEGKSIGGDIISGILEGLVIPQPIKAFVDFLSWVKQFFGIHSPSTVFKDIGGNLIAGLWEGISEAWNTFIENVGKKWEELKTSMSETWENIKTNASEKWESVKSTVSEKFTETKEKVSETADKVKEKVQGAWSTVKDKTSSTFENLKTSLTTTANNIKSTLEQRWSEIKTKAANDWQALKTDVSGKFDNLKTSLTTTSNNIKSTLSSAWDSVKSTASTKWGELKTNVSGLYTSLRDTLNNTSFTSVGKNIINGIWKGISDGWDWLKKKVKEVADSLLSAAKDALGIESPSKEFAEVGEYVVKGMGKGLETYNTIKNTVITFANAVVSWFKGSGNMDIANRFFAIAGEVIDSFKNKITGSFTDTQSPMTNWAESVRKWFNNGSFGGVNTASWIGYANEVITGFKDKITSGYTATQSPMTTWASSVKTWFTNHCSYSSFYNVASDVVSGFKNGIGELYSTCKNTISSWGASIISWFKKKLESNSPSKVFYRIGSDTILGYNNAIKEVGKSTKGIVSDWSDSFTDIKPKVSLDTSDLKNYSANYGTDFKDAIITHKVQREMGFNSSVQAEIDGGKFSEDMRRVIVEELAPYLSRIDNSTQRQADKKEQVNVEIGRRTVRDAVVEQRAADGFNFTPSLA